MLNRYNSTLVLKSVLSLALFLLLAAPRAGAVATVFTQTYAATTAAGGTLMTSGNAATVTVARAALRDTVSNTGNTFNFPFAGSGNTAIRSQFLIEQPQLDYGGVVDSIGMQLNAASASSVTFSNFTIKLVHTLHSHSGTTITSTFATNYDGNTPVTVFGPATLVVPAHSAGAIQMIDVANTFTYDNTSNLIVEITWSNAAATSDVLVTSNTDNGNRRWNVTATGSTTATTGTTGKDADFFIVRFAGDNVVVHPYDATNASVAAGTGSTYAYDAASTGSTSTQRWQCNQTLTGSVATNTVTRTFYDQYLPTITLNGTSAGNTVATTAHTKFGASAATSGYFTSFSDWADRGSTLTFAATTSPLAYTTASTRTFTVSSALSATINYVDTSNPTVTVNSPNGGESWDIGSVHNITWTAADNTGVTAVDLAYSTNGGTSYTSIATGLANSGSYAWTVPNAPTVQARVRATVHDAASNSAVDASDANFTIADLSGPVVAVSSPNGGESWDIGSVHNLTWTATDNIGVTSVDLDYSTNGGTSYTSIATGLANSGSYSWTVPNAPTTQARVRATAHDAASHSTADASDANFTIADLSAPVVTVSSPNGGEVWAEGSVHNITWTATDNVGVTSVDIDYSTDGGGSWTGVAAGVANSGTYPWTVPNTPTVHARVRVSAHDAAGNHPGLVQRVRAIAGLPDMSDADFTIADQIAPAVTVVVPNGGEIWYGGQLRAISWTASDLHGVTSVDILLSTDGGATYPTSVASGLPNSGSYTWMVTNMTQPACKIRVAATDPSSNVGEDVSDATFEIRDALTAIALASFTGDAFAGHVDLTWSLSGLHGGETVDLARRVTGDAVFARIATGLPAGASMTYRDASVLPGASYDYRITVHGLGSADAERDLRVVTPEAAFALHGVVPNPSRGDGVVRYSLHRAAQASLEVLDLAGRRVRWMSLGTQEAGEHSVQWDGRDQNGQSLGAGVYFVRLSAEGRTAVRRCVLVR